MARIRNIKPEFFINPELQDLEASNPGAYPMMVYEGLWTQSSKNGVFLWEPRILKLYILPFLPFDISETMEILYRAGFLKKFQHEGKKYGYIPTFREHQTISGQEINQKAKYPDYTEGSDWHVSTDMQGSEDAQGSDMEVTSDVLGSKREARGTADLGHRTLDIGHRTLDVGNARGAPTASSAPPPQKITETNPSRCQRFSKPSLEEVSAYCLERGNGIAPDKFIAHYESNGWMVGRTHMKDWRAAIRTWEHHRDIDGRPQERLPVYDRGMLNMQEG